MTVRHTFRPVHHSEAAAPRIDCQRILERSRPTEQRGSYVSPALQTLKALVTRGMVHPYKQEKASQPGCAAKEWMQWASQQSPFNNILMAAAEVAHLMQGFGHASKYKPACKSNCYWLLSVTPNLSMVSKQCEKLIAKNLW